MKFAVRKRRAPSIIIVSLVDILTILLIFFVVSTTFKKDQPEVQINLPDSKTSTKSSSELEHAVVAVQPAESFTNHVEHPFSKPFRLRGLRRARRESACRRQ